MTALPLRTSAPQGIVLAGVQIVKTFGPTLALNGVQAELRMGEIQALMGENGSGKSTLLSVLSGSLIPESGYLEVKGRRYPHLTPALARQLGIAVVSQEPQMAPALSVAENIFLGRLIKRGARVDWAQTTRQASKLLERLELTIDARAPVSSLSLGRRQMIEIAKALVDQPAVLLLDEATSSLDDADTRTLFALLQRLRDQGTAIGFVSHRMAEVMELADRVTVLRDGQYIGERLIRDTDENELVSMMVGRDLKSYWQKAKVDIGPEVLALRDVNRGPLKQITLSLHQGEILGVAGLVGSGRSALLRTIAGVRTLSEGQMTLHGAQVRPRSPRHARQLGIGYVPEDRKGEGLLLDWSLRRNASLSRAARLRPWAIVTRAFDKLAYAEGTAGLKVKAANPDQAIRELSGGNQQKVVIARELALTPNILLLDEPTRGVDVGAKEDIYAQIARLVRQGMSLVIASSELQELIGVCDRIIVMHDGRIAAEVPAHEATEEVLAYWASGAHEAGTSCYDPMKE